MPEKANSKNTPNKIKNSAQNEKPDLDHDRKAKSVSAYSGYMLFYMIAVVITKIIGFTREIFITSRFGYGNISDGYILGFSVPDLVYQILVGGAISSAVTPTLSAAIERDEEDKCWSSISTFYTVIFILFFAFMIVGEIFSPQIISFLNPGKAAEIIDIATSVSRVIFLQTFFFILIATINATLSANKVYGLPALGDSVYNLFCLLGIAVLGSASKEGAVRSACGVVFAAFMYFIYMYHFARPYLKKFRPNLQLKDRQFWRLVWLAVPALLSGTVAQLNLITQQRFTNQFAGAVTSLRNATTLFNLPYQIIVTSLGAFLLPNISGFLARGDKKQASEFFNKTLRLVLFILIPAIVVFLLFPEDTVRAVYQWNTEAYTEDSVRATASLLRIYSLNFIFATINYFIQQVFYSMQKNYITLITAIVNLGLNYAMCALLINGLGLGIESLAIATTVGYVVEFLICIIVLRKLSPGLVDKSYWKFFLKAVVGAFLSYSVLTLLNTLLPLSMSKGIQILQYILYVLAAYVVYFLAADFMDMEEVQGVFNMFKQLFAKITQKKSQA